MAVAFPCRMASYSPKSQALHGLYCAVFSVIHFSLSPRDLSCVGRDGERFVARGEYSISVGSGQLQTSQSARPHFRSSRLARCHGNARLRFRPDRRTWTSQDSGVIRRKRGRSRRRRARATERAGRHCPSCN